MTVTLLPIHIDVEESLGTFARREHIQREQGIKVLKLASDLDRYAQIIAATRPEVIVECGNRFGGSALWFERHGLDVIAVDLDPGAGSRARPLATRTTWITGSSADPAVAAQVAALVRGRRTMVTLDSDHTAPHVSREIALYGPLTSPGCYMVVEDTIFDLAPASQLRELVLAPLIDAGGPLDAVEDLLAGNDEWRRDEDIERLWSTSHHPAGWWVRRG
jgi:cephalosporin hydroxylase